MGTEFLPALMLLVATAAGVLSIYGMAALVRSSSVEIERDEEISQAGGVGAERISFG